MKDYVKITSTKSITVTGGLQYKNLTKTDSDLADRIKIAPLWPKSVITIIQGTHYYPSEIIEWDAVKKLANLDVITIASGSYNEDELPENEKSLCKPMKKKLQNAKIQNAGKETKKEKVVETTTKENNKKENIKENIKENLLEKLAKE